MMECPPDQAPDPTAVTALDAEAELARLAKALGHPARVRILKLLIEKDRCVAGELSDELPIAASTVSQHLKLLKEAGLIKGEVDGPRRGYCVDPSVLALFKTRLEELR